MKSPLDHALGLLKKASNDLVAARATLATGEAFDMVCFHAQQAVEKSLKAVLALQDVEYPWRHDLGELVILAERFLPDIAPLEDQIINLTPFAVEARYHVFFEPSADEANSALQVAVAVHALADRFVKQDD